MYTNTRSGPLAELIFIACCVLVAALAASFMLKTLRQSAAASEPVKITVGQVTKTAVGGNKCDPEGRTLIATDGTQFQMDRSSCALVREGVTYRCDRKEGDHVLFFQIKAKLANCQEG